VFKKFIMATVAVGFLSACSAGQKAANEGGEYVWIGCHIVHTNPANCNSGNDQCKVYAFDIGGDSFIGERIYFKQLRKGQDRDDPVGPIRTARPCSEDNYTSSAE
tara:strand:+ start:376 stop:690 length:315 start_codon:yes stop_codon:yes gene_type:complete